MNNKLFRYLCIQLIPENIATDIAVIHVGINNRSINFINLLDGNITKGIPSKNNKIPMTVA